MPQLDFANPLMMSKLVWLLIIFGFLYFVLKNYALPQVASVLDERAARIAADLDAARDAQAAGEAALAEIRAATAAARAEAQAAIAAAMLEAQTRSAAQAAEINARLAAQVAPAPVVRVPFLRSDVHDLDGLAEVGRLLLDPDGPH